MAKKLDATREKHKAEQEAKQANEQKKTNWILSNRERFTLQNIIM